MKRRLRTEDGSRGVTDVREEHGHSVPGGRGGREMEEKGERAEQQ